MSGTVHLLPLYAFMTLTVQFYLLYIYCRLEYDPVQSSKQSFRFHSYFLFETVLTIKTDESLSSGPVFLNLCETAAR